MADQQDDFEAIRLLPVDDPNRRIWEQGAKAMLDRIIDLLETHANDGIYSRMEQDTWQSVADLIRRDLEGEFGP